MDSNESSTQTNGRSTAFDELRTQLEDPATADVLRDILSKLDVIQFSLHALDGALRRAEAITDNVADGVNDAKATIEPRTLASLGRLVALTPSLVDALDKISPALESDGLEKLGDPALVDALAGLADKAPLLLFAAEAATGFLERAEVVIDNVADSVQDVKKLAADGPREAFEMLSTLGGLLPAVQTLLNEIAPLLESGAFEALVQSTILHPENVQAVSRVGDALKATQVAQAAAPQQLGLFGMMRALRDPDAQRALGFFATFLKEFGKQMR
ncbi:MAG: DUF1641 domain-containing protein [Planctomycetota bacterium]